MSDTVKSKHGIPIRLTAERWTHIIDGHNELAGMREHILETVAFPERVLAGNRGELLAVREEEPNKFLVVVYREFEQDGFIITAFMTRNTRFLKRRGQLWP